MEASFSKVFPWHFHFSHWIFLRLEYLQPAVWDGKTLVFAILRKIVLEIPALFILDKLFPLYGLAYAQFTAELILSAIGMITLIRLFKNLDNKSVNNNQ